MFERCHHQVTGTLSALHIFNLHLVMALMLCNNITGVRQTWLAAATHRQCAGPCQRFITTAVALF
jgi:hypothetical protein